MVKDYLQIYYSEDIKPKTTYPFQLIKYLIRKSLNLNIILSIEGKFRN